MSKTKAEVACAPYVDAWRDGFRAGQIEAFEWCLDLVRAAWMEQASDALEGLGKEIADELKRKTA